MLANACLIMAPYQSITTLETAFNIRDDSPGGDTQLLESDDSKLESKLYLQDRNGDVKWFFLGHQALRIQGLEIIAQTDPGEEIQSSARFSLALGKIEISKSDLTASRIGEKLLKVYEEKKRREEVRARKLKTLRPRGTQTTWQATGEAPFGYERMRSYSPKY